MAGVAPGQGRFFSGGGFEGDAVVECFELADVVASFGVGVDVSVVVVGADSWNPVGRRRVANYEIAERDGIAGPR
jgi:hypothetical protein